MAKTIPGHLYGPCVPTVGYWFGDRFLGEVRLRGDCWYDPKYHLSRSYDFTHSATEAHAMRGMLYSPDCTAKRYH